jgi:TonB-dependent starch-binding outer membrane protein SusC
MHVHSTTKIPLFPLTITCKMKNKLWLWKRHRKSFAFLLLFLAASFIINAQVVISGKVTGADGKPLASVTVQILNTNAGTATDANGDYNLTANLKDGSYTVSFTSVGLKPVEKAIQAGTTKTFTFDVQLQEDVLGLNEVIVTGTAVATAKKKLGNAVATVTARDLQYSASTGIDGALQGKIAGAQITQNSGNPAGGISVRLRGPSTIIGSSDPLYIIDGVIVNNDSRQLIDLGGYTQNRLVDINPADIERVEVIKGAAAAAIYGSRANNGVVQIFTKKGRTGAPQISFSTQFKTNSIRKKLPHNEYPFRFNNAVVTDTSRTFVTRYDYQDEIFRAGIGTENNLAVSGGTESTKYYVAASNLYNEGIIDNTNFNRNSLRINLTQKLSRIFTLSAGANYAISNSREIPNGGLLEAYGALTGFIFSNNYVNPAKNPVTGLYPSTAPIAILRRTNPLEAIERFDFRQRVNRFTGNVQLNAKPVTGLNIDYIVGLDNYTQSSTAYIPPNNTTPSYNGGLARRADATVFQINNDLNISYRRKINDWLESTTALGGTVQYERLQTIFGQAQTLGAFGQTINNGVIVAGELRSESSILGAFLQQTFGIKDRIFITGAGRVDASSVYGSDNRWQFFPKVSGAYIISEEDFWSNSKLAEIIPSLKLRAAWGQSGNLTAIGPYQRLANYFPISYGGITGYVPDSSMGNPGLRPERQIELELGADISMLKDRLSIEFTWFSKDVEDLLLNRTLAPSTGYSTKVLNIGTMTNKGFEFLIKGVPVQNKNVTWITAVNYTNNKNTVDGVEGNGVLPFAGGFGQVAAVNGYSLGAFYSTFFARNADGSLLLTPGGLPQRERGTQQAKGTYTIGRDANGQPVGNILSKVIGDPNPKHIISWINDLSYGKFNFRMQWDGMFGFDVFNFTRRVGDNANYGGLKGYEAELKGEVPKGTSAALFSIFENWIEKGDFVKLREISVSYQVSPGIWGLRDMRITLAGRNLFSIDDYSGYDPETNAAGQTNAVRGFDFVEVPLPRTILIGLNVNF